MTRVISNVSFYIEFWQPKSLRPNRLQEPFRCSAREIEVFL